jgi:imidazolonepropionase-like amidohydrolase
MTPQRLRALLALSLVCAQPVSAQQAIAIVGATVIDGTGGPPIANATVLVRGNRIAAVGPRAAVAVPPGATIVDGAGKYVTPGLIDNNVHLILMIVPEFYIKYEGRLEEIAIQSAQVALKYGVTTVRDSWGPLQPLLRARDRINSGQVAGSRMLVAGNIVGLGGPFSEYFLKERGASTSSLVQQRINEIWEENVGPSLLAKTEPEVRAEIRKYLARDIDFLKVAVSGHGVRGEPLMFSPEVLKAIGEEVHAAGKIYETHTATPESLRLAIEAGADLLQHPESVGPDREVPDDLIARIKEKKIFCGILTASESFVKTIEEQRFVNPWFAGLDPKRYGQRIRNYRKMVAARVRLALATDNGPQAWDIGYRPMSPLIGRKHFDTMEDYQAAGLSPMEVLVASTRTGAEASGMAEDLGTIEPGKFADLLVLNADPLVTVANFRKIDRVYRGGKLVDRGRLPENPVLIFDPELTFDEWSRRQKGTSTSQ